MNEAQAARWSQIRQKGKAKYVMYRGVLLWGVVFTLLFTGIEWLTQDTFTPRWFSIRLAVFAIAGFFAANFRWDSNEIKFKRRK